MIVLHLFDEIKFSGAEVMVANAAPQFQAQDIELRAFATGKEMGDFEPVFKVRGIVCEHHPVDYGSNPWHTLIYYRWFYQYLKKEQISAIHIHRNTLWLACIVAYLAGIRCIKTQHNVFRNRWFTLPIGISQRFVVRKIFGTIFHSIGDSVERNEREYYWNPTVQINNWYDANRYYPPRSPQEKIDMRRLLDLPTETIVIVSVGSCTNVKNHHDILHAMHQIAGNGNFLYLHLGSGSTEMEERMLAQKLGILEQVRFLGNQQDIRKYLIASDVFIMSSRFEGLSIAAIEAMACAMPLIVYDVPGLRDLVKNNDTGFLIPEDVGVMVQKILELSLDYKLRDRMGRVAFEKASSEYRQESSVNSLMKLYGLVT